MASRNYRGSNNQVKITASRGGRFLRPLTASRGTGGAPILRIVPTGWTSLAQRLIRR